MTGKGLTNVAEPDTDATYWVMPVDTSRWQAMLVTGSYPQARFFSLTAYHELRQGGVTGFIIDADIVPSSGENPFEPGSGGNPGTYTVRIDADAAISTNHVTWPSADLAYVIYRVYVADRGFDREGGVHLPSLALVDKAGSAHPVPVCPRSARSGGGADELVAALEAKFPVGAQTCPPDGPASDVVAFAPNTTPGRFFPNPVTTYVAAKGLCLTRDQVLVIRGKAPNYPDTYDGGSIFDPVLAGGVQVRYWSLCNNEEQIPLPVVACQPDYSTLLDSQGFYTYILSYDESGVNPPVPPPWLPPDTTWLPWGEAAVQSDLLFREMLPTERLMTPEYLPTGVVCSKQTLIKQGWHACFTTAKAMLP